MDNTINRVIRSIYIILKSKGLSSLVAEFEAYDKYLCSMGVGAEVVDVHEIDFSIDTVDGPTYTLNALLQVILDVVADYDNRKFHCFWLVSDMHLCMLG